MEVPSPEWAENWQSSWDRLEERYIPDREAKLSALIDVLEAMADSSCTVIDLACGTGSVTRRILARMPSAHSISVDVDPVLLTIARATFAGDNRVRVVTADLRHEDWFEALQERQVDSVLTATALHWLSEDVVRRLYADLSTLIRPGGVFAHLEVMPLDDLPRLSRGHAGLVKERHRVESTEDTDWDAWWEAVLHDPVLASLVADRRAIFDSNYPTKEFSPPAEWHIETLRAAGFAEAGVVWRVGAAAIVAAVR